MKAEEIRIGNLLTINGNIIEVKGISPHCGDYAINIEDSWVYLKNCEPILLSEEWLVKAGFEERKIDRYMFYELRHRNLIFNFNDDQMSLGVHGFANIEWSESNIVYVHQLQNIYFALTGQELILKQ